jgi:cytochrome c553
MIATASVFAGALAVMAAGTAAPSLSGMAIAEQGNGRGAPACASCHGAHFEGQPMIKAPALAGRPADFIVARLDHYAGPDGKNATMKMVATALSAADRRAVASYLAHLPPAPTTPH